MVVVTLGTFFGPALRAFDAIHHPANRKVRRRVGLCFARLQDTPTARKILDALPIASRASTWGEEVYFDTGVEAELEDDARQVVDPGTVCFWVEGKSLALPYGPTPVSQGDECRLVTDVNVLGALEGAARVLATVQSGDAIEVELAAD